MAEGARISGKARVAGVMGWPVRHSLSPVLHNYWLAQHGLDGAYVPLSVNPAHLEPVIRALPLMGFAGVNLTLPHKELVLPLLDRVDAAAAAIGAVNAVIIAADGSLHGMNTDAYGFIENIRPRMTGKRKAVLLGAGGAARAVACALRQEGFEQIMLANRSRGRAEALAAACPGLTAIDWQDRAGALAEADLLVNATSLGMTGSDALDLDLTLLPPAALVTDIVYTPLETPLLRRAAARGNPVVDGLGMLLHQAVPAFEAWFGPRPEVTQALRRHCLGL